MKQKLFKKLNRTTNNYKLNYNKFLISINKRQNSKKLRLIKKYLIQLKEALFNTKIQLNNSYNNKNQKDN